MSCWKMNGFFDNSPAPFCQKFYDKIIIHFAVKNIIKLNSSHCRNTLARNEQRHNALISFPQVKYYNLFRKTCFIFQIYLIASNKYINYLNENENKGKQFLYFREKFFFYPTQLNHLRAVLLPRNEWIKLQMCWFLSTE